MDRDNRDISNRGPVENVISPSQRHVLCAEAVVNQRKSGGKSAHGSFGPLYVDVEVAQPLAPAGFTRTQAKGDHEKWTLGGCHVVIPHARDISPGVVRQVLKAIGRSTS